MPSKRSSHRLVGKRNCTPLLLAVVDGRNPMLARDIFLHHNITDSLICDLRQIIAVKLSFSRSFIGCENLGAKPRFGCEKIRTQPAANGRRTQQPHPCTRGSQGHGKPSKRFQGTEVRPRRYPTGFNKHVCRPKTWLSDAR